MIAEKFTQPIAVFVGQARASLPGYSSDRRRAEVVAKSLTDGLAAGDSAAARSVLQANLPELRALAGSGLPQKVAVDLETAVLEALAVAATRFDNMGIPNPGRDSSGGAPYMYIGTFAALLGAGIVVLGLGGVAFG